MKIKVEPREKCDAIICLEKECPWKKACASHETAGDFRSEGGARPLLKLMNGELHCDTYHSKGDGFEYNEMPINVDTWVPNRWNMFLWSQLIEQVDSFQI
jgi:hypothetical protein